MTQTGFMSVAWLSYGRAQLRVRGGSWTWALALALAGTVLSRAAEDGPEAIFSTKLIPQIKIQATPAELDKLRGRDWGWGAINRERPEIVVTVREGGTVYTNVALHLKGSAGSFQPVEAKPGLTLNFDKHAKGQRFHGLSKLSLNNSVQDPSYFSERICRELFRAAGVPAPRAGFATVELNGRTLGFYVLLEGYNRQFLKHYFKNTRGNLYDGGFLKDVDSRLSTNSGEDPKNQSDLQSLVAAAREPDRTLRYSRLADILDMDRFVSFLACEVMVCHWDGYAMNKNNFRVYHDMDKDRILFMPHGMDQMFGVMMADATLQTRPPMRGLVAKALLETGSGSKQYLQRLRELNQTIFNLTDITNELASLAERVRPALLQLGPEEATNHDLAVVALRDRIVARKANLDDQLSGAPGRTLEFDSSGVALLSGWTSQTNFGKPLFSQEAGSGSRTILHISAQRGSSVGSWRARVLLEDGHYVFRGRMRTAEIQVDPQDFRAGAGLRIAGRPAVSKARGSSGWSDVTCEFDLPDGIHEVECVCELRAAGGEVWFDASSLELVRP